MRRIIGFAIAVLCLMVALGILVNVLQRNPRKQSASRSPAPPVATYNGFSFPCHQVDEGRWLGVDVCLPPGNRFATYDSARDVIWIASDFPSGSSDTAPSPLLITKINARTLEGTTRFIKADVIRFPVGAGLTTDPSGNLWLAWGKYFARYDEQAGSLQYFPFPKLDAGVFRKLGSHADGFAIDLLYGRDHKLWMVVHSYAALHGYDPLKRTWTSVPTSGFVPLMGSALEQLADGRLAVMGIKGPLSHVKRPVIVVNPRSRASRVLSRDVWAYAVRSGSEILDVDEQGFFALENPDNGKVVEYRAARVSIPRPGRGLAMSSGTTAWTFSWGRLKLDIVKVDTTNGRLTRYPFPLAILKGPGNAIGRRIEGPVAAGLKFERCIVDKRNDVWVITDQGNVAANDGSMTGRNPYASIYRFRARDLS